MNNKFSENISTMNNSFNLKSDRWAIALVRRSRRWKKGLGWLSSNHQKIYNGKPRNE
jgi:hypothetical protein